MALVLDVAKAKADEPVWLDLGSDCRVKLRRPGACSMMQMIRPIEQVLALKEGEVEVTAEDDETVVRDLVKLAELLAQDWDGVEDPQGKAIPWSTDAFGAMLRAYPLIASNFVNSLVAFLGEVHESEKKDYEPSPIGKQGSGKKAGTIAESATKKMPRAAAGNGASEELSAHG